jgi:2-phospho-L-lactate guanylyltransferase (CobY/MobA/RfbA family)
VLPPKAVQDLVGIPQGIGEAEIVSADKTVNDYVGELKTLLDNTRAETEQENKMINDKLFDVAKDQERISITQAKRCCSLSQLQ